ncbi:MAG TPA: lytic transglycosylase domain-containing protein [Longimicrobiales bacterium]
MSEPHIQQQSYVSPRPPRRSGRVIVSFCVATAMFVLGAAAAREPRADPATLLLQQELRAARRALSAREGELELARLELQRLSQIVDHSKTHRIPADLATAIYDIALSEGVDPALAFSLVRVESGFTRRAVSSAGAVGLTQVMPKTAFWLQPGLSRDDLFERDTNLRLGFRYLRMMLEQYDGDLHLALLAYNRGPGRVDDILRAGGDPSNGYSFNVRAGLSASAPSAFRLRGD